jgi:hypothetical protein
MCFRRSYLWLVLVLVLAACQSDGGPVSTQRNPGPTAPIPVPPAPNPGPTAPNPVPVPPAAECGADSFPCSLDQVSLAVLERGEMLADEVVAKLDGGASLSDALAFLLTQADVADAAGNKVALRFRVTGGRDMFVFQPEALSPVPDAGIAPTPAELDRKMTAHLVVGNGAPQKRALVLSPFRYFFKQFDDGAAVAQVLEKTRGYAGNVSYLENATKTAETVGIQQFVGWENYDVIHVTSHGAQICDVNRCVASILTGDIYSSAEDLLRITEQGLNTVRVRGSDEKRLALGPDFFKKHYPGGLARKLIFFNACQTFDAVDSALSDALLGDQSVYFGWTDAVQSDAAQAAALALFQKLSVDGVTSQSALDSLGPLGFNQYTHGGLDFNATLLLDRDVSSDLRIREVVKLERPSGGGELLANATVAAVGTPQDGVVDLVPYQILVEGIPESQQDDAIIQFTVNGHSSTPQAVTIGARVGATGWRLTGQIPYVDVSPEQVVQMIATVQLPEGGTSEHRVTVKLTAGLPETGETWIGEAVSHFDDTTPEGQVHVTRSATVTFKQTAATIGGRFKVLRSTSGTMTWSRSGSIKTLLDGDCFYAFDPIQFPIAANDGEIIIDTGETPSGYSLSGFTQGPEVRVAENCGNYAFSTRAGGAWAPALGHSDGFTVSSDGGLIGGNTGGNFTTWDWTFRRQ